MNSFEAGMLVLCIIATLSAMVTAFVAVIRFIKGEQNMKTVLNFVEMCAILNEYHHNPEYAIAFKVSDSLHLIKYGDNLPHTNDEMQALIRKARDEYRTVKGEQK